MTSLKFRDKKGKFVKGIIPWNKGKIDVYTKEMLTRISNGTKKSLLNLQIREKIKKTQFKKGNLPWNKGIDWLEMRGDNHPFRRNPNLIKKIQSNPNVIKNQFKKGIKPWNKGKKNVYSDEVLKKIKKARLLQIFPKKDTKIEMMMQRELKRRKIKFKIHDSLFDFCQPDILIPKFNLAIFCDGDYWHVNPIWLKNRRKKELTKAQLNNIKRDKDQNIFLKKKGWIVLRFWETDILCDVESCVSKIEKFLPLTAKSSSASSSSTKASKST